MPVYTTPGVYFERLDSSAHTIPIVRTDIAGFVGFAERGPIHDARRLESWTQFSSLFGRHITVGYLAYAVEGFYANGGSVCYVVRVADPAAAIAATRDVRLDDGRTLRLTATSEGRWANSLQVTFTRARSDRMTLALRLPSGEQEQWRDLTFDEDDDRFIVRVLNGTPAVGGDPESSSSNRPQPATQGSRLVQAWISRPANKTSVPIDLRGTTTTTSLDGGEDGLWTVRPEHLSGYGALPGRVWGLAALESVPDVSIVAIPDIMPQFVQPTRKRTVFNPNCSNPVPPSAPPPKEPDPDPDWPSVFSADQIRMLQQQVVAHCEKLRDRVAILDARFEDVNPQAAVEWSRDLSTTYGAIYYPWLRVVQPDHILTLSRLRNVPPCGHMAGVYARVERQVGVHKPPANEVVEGAKDLTAVVDDISHGFLNDQRVNVIRAFPGRSIRAAGARTLSPDSEWRYVNVRRLLVMIERALDRNTQWLVFEPNRQDVWRDVDRVLRAFFDDLWRRGMLDGTSAAEAYLVACDESSMSADDVEQGRFIATIGVKPPWPAEFVIARIGRTQSGLQMLEGQGDTSGAVGRA
jgi:phage tail sheath protein FI